MPEPTIQFPNQIDERGDLLIAVNGLHTQLTTNISPTATSLLFTDLSRFPDRGYLTLTGVKDSEGLYEVIYYNGKNGNNLTNVVRGADNTTAMAHTRNEHVFGYINAAYHNILAEAIHAIEVNLGVGVSDSMGGGLANRVTALENELNGISSNFPTSRIDSNEVNIRDVSSGLAQEIIDRISADSILQFNIDNVSSFLISEVSRSTTAESILDTKIDNVSSGIHNRITNEVAGLVDSSPAALDTLNELANALGDDENFATTITNQISNVSTAIDTEILDRTSADNTLQINIDNVSTDINTRIDNHESWDTSQYSILQTNMDGVSLAFNSHENDLSLHVTSNQSFALDNATAPGASNPYATIGDLPIDYYTQSQIDSQHTTLQNNIDNVSSSHNSRLQVLENQVDEDSWANVSDQYYNISQVDTLISNVSQRAYNLEQDPDNDTWVNVSDQYYNVSEVDTLLANVSTAVGNVSAIDGGVFITDITPTDSGNVGNKVTSSDGFVLDSCISDTTNITVHVLAITGHTTYKPVITVEGSSVSNLTINEDKTVWTGSVALDITGKNSVTALHDDGAEWTTDISIEAGPEVASATFTGGYPGSQTELKENDNFNLIVTTDKDMVSIEVQDYEACKSATFNFPGTTSKTVSVTIANRGTTATLRPARVRAKDSNGSWGNWYDTDTSGSVDGTNVVNVNNKYPSISIGSITYPGNQEALKGSETATVVNTASDYDSITYSSPNGDLLITSTSSFQNPKTVQRIAGTYNISSTNFRISATRNANNSTTVVNGVVKIADADPIITVSESSARLRSGGNNGTSQQNHTITISSNQHLIETPSLSCPVGTQGSWSGGPTSYTCNLGIHDNDAKGTYTYTGLNAKNLAGKVVTTITGNNSYVVGGFVFRTLTVSVPFSRETAIGTQVSDTSKLRCTNLSKGASGSLNFTYSANIADVVDEFTITQPTGVFNPAGNTWYNKDAANAGSNSAGTMQIELEEIV